MVKTKIKESTIPGAGFGLFADEDIKSNTITWRFCPGYDIVVSKDDLLRFSKESRAQFLNYCYFDKATKHFILCGDNERFINHSITPNIIQRKSDEEMEGIEIAARDIKRGEELLVNYYDYDEDAERKFQHKDEYAYLTYSEEGKDITSFYKKTWTLIKNKLID